MPIVYKVVRKLLNGNLISLVVPQQGKYSVRYRLTETAKSPIGGLFCFKTLYRARSFASCFSGGTVLRCKAKGKVNSKLAADSLRLYDRDIERFWHQGDLSMTHHLISGTVLYKEVTPLYEYK